MYQTFSKELVYDRIKDSGFPFWCLGMVQGFKNTVNVMQYWGNDFEDEDSDETKIDKSIKRLDAVVSSGFPSDTVFVIEIKNSKTANQSGIIGPFYFQNALPRPTSSEPQQPQMQVSPQNGLTGYPNFDETLKGIEEKLSAKFNSDLAAYKLETEKKMQEDSFRQREEKLKEREAELKDLKKAYESGVAKVADVIVLAGKKIFAYFFPEMPGFPPDGSQPNLGKLQEPAQPVQDEKVAVIESFADYLYNNFDKDSIQKIQEDIINRQKQTQYGTQIHTENSNVAE
jgi:hypothetical protein